jgi:hypothetical protein
MAFLKLTVSHFQALGEMAEGQPLIFGGGGFDF